MVLFAMTATVSSNASGAGGGGIMMVLVAKAACISRSRLGGPTTGSGASYLSGECLVMASITITNTGSGLLDAWSSIGICVAPLLRLCQNHGCRDARKTIVPSEIARSSEPLAGLASLCQTFSEGD